MAETSVGGSRAARQRAAPRILVSESAGFSRAAALRLSNLGDLQLADLQRLELLIELGEANVLWVRLRHKIDGEVFRAAPCLRAIVSPTTGVDHIDLGAARDHSVEVLSLRGRAEELRDVRATAEHTVGLMLSLLRQVPAAVRHVRAGGWDRDLFWGQELYRKSVGIVGYGRLGRLVARYLVAFGARRVLVCDQPGRAVADLDEGVKACSLDELLSRSDIVTLHASLNDSTRGLLGARELALMPTGSWLVNTARGALVVEDALVAALRDGPLAGAALDVLADEHGDRSRQLLDYARANANVLITPHIGGATIESRAKTEELMVAPLAEFLATERAGRPPASDG